jgi:hypothetical protein
MNYWGAGFSVAFEINRPVINLVLDKFLQAFKSQLKFQARLGKIGNLNAEVTDVEILDLTDPAPLGGVVTDLMALAHFKLKIFGIRLVDTILELKVLDVEIDLTRTAAGLPKGLSLGIRSTTGLKLSFPNAKFIIGWMLNKVISPVITFGIWLVLSLLRGRKIEIPVWELVDSFSALGLRYADNSPLLTAQNTIPPTSVLLGTDFTLTSTNPGIPQNLGHFIPSHTSLGVVVNDKVVTAAVQTAFAKGWVPKQFKVKGWKIYINTIAVNFEKDKIRVSGRITAKRGKCWCRVKVRVYYNAAVEPEIRNPHNNPVLAFGYDAVINANLSSSGMLVVLGIIMFTPLIMALTMSLSGVINLMLDKFLPFKTSITPNGPVVEITAASIHVGYQPLKMNFPLKLSGNGNFSLTNFTTFNLPMNGPAMDVVFTAESVSLQADELRLAIDLA